MEALYEKQPTIDSQLINSYAALAEKQQHYNKSTQTLYDQFQGLSKNNATSSSHALAPYTEQPTPPTAHFKGTVLQPSLSEDSQSSKPRPIFHSSNTKQGAQLIPLTQLDFEDKTQRNSFSFIVQVADQVRNIMGIKLVIWLAIA